MFFSQHSRGGSADIFDLKCATIYKPVGILEGFALPWSWLHNPSVANRANGLLHPEELFVQAWYTPKTNAAGELNDGNFWIDLPQEDEEACDVDFLSVYWHIDAQSTLHMTASGSTLVTSNILPSK
ncbi:hypothetical protein YC2023_033496 [Brassica napus]